MKSKKTNKKAKKTLSEKQKEALKKGQIALAAKKKLEKIEKLSDVDRLNESTENYASNLKQITSLDVPQIEDQIKNNKETKEDIVSEIPFQFGEQNQVDFEGNPINEIPGNLDEMDIWEFAYKKLEPLGDVPKFIIYRNGEMLTTKMYPYSWQQLQEEFGGGHYKVQARSSNRQTIIKTQTQIIANLPNNQNIQRAQPIEEVKKTSEATTLEKLIEIVQNLQDKIKSESKQNDSLQLAAQANMNTTVMNMVQAQAKQTSDMIIQMTKFQMEMSNKQMEMISKSLEKLGESLKENKKDDGMDFVKMLTLLKETEKASEDRTLKFLELAEKKAELAREQALENADNGPHEKESITDTLIRSFAPALGQIIAANASQNAAQRGVLLQPMYQEASPIQPNSSIKKPSEEVIRNDVKSNKTEVRAIKTQPRIVQQKPVDRKPNENSNELINKLETILIPILAEDMQLATEPSLTAKKCIEAMHKVGVLPKTVLEKIKIDDILNVVRKFELSEAQLEWIKEVYANIEKLSSITAKPISKSTTPNAQLQA